MSINTISNNSQFNLHSNDIMINIIDIIKNDINCLMLLTQTNKEIRDNIIKNTTYIDQIDNIKNTSNFNKMFQYIKMYSSSIVYNNYPNLKVYDTNNNIIKYFAKIQKLIPYMVPSQLYAFNVMLCVNYSSVKYWANNPPKYIDKCMIEESKIMYYIIKKIDPLYQIVITPDNYIVKFDSKELIDWLDNLNSLKE